MEDKKLAELGFNSIYLFFMLLFTFTFLWMFLYVVFINPSLFAHKYDLILSVVLISMVMGCGMLTYNIVMTWKN